MKRHRVHSGQSKYFRGELMTCAGCGRKQKSSPNTSSGWTILIAGNASIYLCPSCYEVWIAPEIKKGGV